MAATEATNGFVYVLGKVMIDEGNNQAPTGNLGKISDILKRIPEASVFANLLEQTDLASTVQGWFGSLLSQSINSDCFMEASDAEHDTSCNCMFHSRFAFLPEI